MNLIFWTIFSGVALFTIIIQKRSGPKVPTVLIGILAFCWTAYFGSELAALFLSLASTGALVTGSGLAVMIAILAVCTHEIICDRKQLQSLRKEQKKEAPIIQMY